MSGAGTSGVLVRDGVVADVPDLVALIAGGAVGGPVEADPDLGPYAEAMREITAGPHDVVLVAEIGRHVVGMCQLIGFRHVHHRGGLCAEVESMHVAADHRGAGIGGLLLAAAVERAREWGCYRIQLTSNVARTDAHRFYAAQGFTASHVGFQRLLDT